MSTNTLKASEIKRSWHQIDASSQILGRMATEAAKILMGKHKQNYVPYLDNGDFVVVTNATKVKVTGKKAAQKKYVRHSGYPGGLKVETFNTLISRKPEEVIRHAVKGMLPKTKLGKQMIKKLYVYSSSEHPYAKNISEKE